MPRPAPRHTLLDRGVWIAPWLGPAGEMVLLAVTTRHQLAVDPMTVPTGASQVLAAELLWDQLEELDPDTSAARTLRVI